MGSETATRGQTCYHTTQLRCALFGLWPSLSGVDNHSSKWCTVRALHSERQGVPVHRCKGMHDMRAFLDMASVYSDTAMLRIDIH